MSAMTWPAASELPGSAAAPGASLPSSVAFDVLVLAGSLGAPEAIREIVGGLPAWFPASILVVQHRTPAAQHLTVELLRRSQRLPVELAQAGDRPQPGVVHVLPADEQLVVGLDGRFVPVPGPLGHGSRANPLLDSVAQHFGARALGVVLSGTNDDGASGIVALRRAGGWVLAQNHATARCFAMPAAAIATGCVDLVLPVDRIAHALLSLVAWPGAADLLRGPLAAWAVLD